MAVRIIGIGASAGGLQALESFFSELPAKLGVAFVVVQHLPLDHLSSMASILQRSSKMPVVPLKKNTLAEPDHIYVNQPKFEVTVSDMLWLTPRDPVRNALYLPIDDFFFSLAESRKEEAIGIVLSGMGTDGSRGMKEIKARGGLVMVQHPDSAQFNGMPRSVVRQHIADVVLPPALLASRLTMILRQGRSVQLETTQLTDLNDAELLNTLLERIRVTTRIDFTHYRQTTILRRIEKRILITEAESLRAYITTTLENEEELQQLRQSFLIGVTRFFRDQEAFEILKNQIIPKLFEHKTTDEEVRVWVPSCSTGEEAYSVAILMQEYVDGNNLNVPYRIFGSDVDRNSIIFASQGIYDSTIAADLPAGYLQRYFSPTSSGYQVKTELKENILFAVQNLLDDPPFIRIDLLSCRNFLIYINSDIQQRILANFHFGLNPTGYLFLGPSESLGPMKSAFTSVNRRWKIYHKKVGGKTLSGETIAPVFQPITINKTPQLGSQPKLKERSSLQPEQTAEQTPSKGKTTMDIYARYLSERYAPPTLFVDRNYDILYLNGDFNGILQMPRYNARLSLLTVMNDDAQKVITAGVDRVMKSKSNGSYEQVNIAGRDQPERLMKVRFGVQDFLEAGQEVATVEFVPVEDVELPTKGDDGEVYTVTNRLKEKIRELQTELLRSEQRAHKLYNELEATNEELQSSNRELLASNEEMQSTNEELQSVNEELYTVNNEFQRKNEELNDINNDVTNLMKSTQISTIFVDNDLRIRRFTPGIGQQFDLHTSDIGRPIAAFATPFNTLVIDQLCAQVLEDNTRIDQEIEDRNGNCYLLRILPYLTDRQEVAGVVITFVDINDLVRTRKRLTDMATKYEAIFHNTQEIIAIVKENSRIEDINLPMPGYSQEALLGIYFTDLIGSAQDKVRFSDSLRNTFDTARVNLVNIALKSDAGTDTKIEIELIPIGNFEGNSREEATVDQVMLIIHDITNVELERKQATQTIERYQRMMSNLHRAAGLINLENERLVMVNNVQRFEDGKDNYLQRPLSEFLTTSGLARFRAALQRIKDGELQVLVEYPVDELRESDKVLQVIYRPVYLKDKLSLISFEVGD
ncbi:two-component system CheB/CheR fusion protein [Lewinella aquimaris]|uniref:Two-component system CheB/CheR fusion protein n=1 Tax=Neolewinella aquimaris TaxID=1835722 RepID=A0A840DZL9_9BACT|nr:chemotaxis protein CheB [Neolewinella aquimaris]MBB4078441.1 two-component system CheB/CheR fusion protein [Neolewinella aquimaris]